MAGPLARNYLGQVVGTHLRYRRSSAFLCGFTIALLGSRDSRMRGDDGASWCGVPGSRRIPLALSWEHWGAVIRRTNVLPLVLWAVIRRPRFRAGKTP